MLSQNIFVSNFCLILHPQFMTLIYQKKIIQAQFYSKISRN